MKSILKISALAVIVTVFAVACNKDDDNMAGNAQVNVRMTDAPGPYVAVNVDVQAVEINTSQGWVNANVNAGIYNLLDYQRGVDTLIASSTIPAGDVSQIRLVLGPNNTVVVGPATFDLETPSAQQSGLKLNVNATVQAGDTYTIILDFDAARSIVETGSGKYILKPVIRALLEANTGVIVGDLGTAGSGALVYAIMDADTIGTVASLTGNFYFGGLQSGDYDVYVDAYLPYEDTTITNVSVSSGQTTNLGNIVLQLQ